MDCDEPASGAAPGPSVAAEVSVDVDVDVDVAEAAVASEVSATSSAGNSATGKQDSSSLTEHQQQEKSPRPPLPFRPVTNVADSEGGKGASSEGMGSSSIAGVGSIAGGARVIAVDDNNDDAFDDAGPDPEATVLKFNPVRRELTNGDVKKGGSNTNGVTRGDNTPLEPVVKGETPVVSSIRERPPPQDGPVSEDAAQQALMDAAQQEMIKSIARMGRGHGRKGSPGKKKSAKGSPEKIRSALQGHVDGVDLSDTENKMKDGKPMCAVKGCKNYTYVSSRLGFCRKHHAQAGSPDKKRSLDGKQNSPSSSRKLKRPRAGPIGRNKILNKDICSDDDEVQFISSSNPMKRATRSLTPLAKSSPSMGVSTGAGEKHILKPKLESTPHVHQVDAVPSTSAPPFDASKEYYGLSAGGTTIDSKNLETLRRNQPQLKVDAASSMSKPRINVDEKYFGLSGGVSPVEEGLCRDHFASPRGINGPVDSGGNHVPKGSPMEVNDGEVSQGVYQSGGPSEVTEVHSTNGGEVGPAKYDAAYKCVGERNVSPSAAGKLVKMEDKPANDDDDISFSEIVLPEPTKGPRRELALDGEMRSPKGSIKPSNWRCSRCGDMNIPKNRCRTCRHSQDELCRKSATPLLERTRYELLSGRDFWICTTCGVGVPSITTPCGVCKTNVSFIPLEGVELEAFVMKDRENAWDKLRVHQRQWQQKLNELHEEWPDENEDQPIVKTGGRKKLTSVNIDHYKNAGNHGKLFCQFIGCKSFQQSNCQGFCREHLQFVLDSAKCKSGPIVFPEDRDLISDDALYSMWRQMESCSSGSSDRGNIHIGYPGINCKHCLGKSGTGGRWFPISESAMYSSSFTRGIATHLQSCSSCPSEVKEKLASLEPEKLKLKEGGGAKKKYIHRLWCRIHRIRSE